MYLTQNLNGDLLLLLCFGTMGKYDEYGYSDIRRKVKKRGLMQPQYPTKAEVMKILEDDDRYLGYVLFGCLSVNKGEEEKLLPQDLNHPLSATLLQSAHHPKGRRLRTVKTMRMMSQYGQHQDNIFHIILLLHLGLCMFHSQLLATLERYPNYRNRYL